MRERTAFYRRDFKLQAVQKWFRGWDRPVVFAAAIGRHTRIYSAKYRRDWNKIIIIDDYEKLSELPVYLSRFSPESAYYDRNVYKDWVQARAVGNEIKGLGIDFGQQLALDIDPENFACPIHGTLSEKMKRHQGLSFCRLELQLAKQQTIELACALSRQFEEVLAVYSGRGFHVHVLDEDTFFWPRNKRRRLALNLSKRGFRIDEWVLSGGMRLIRLPYSLNGLVSRVVLPLEIKELDRFDPLVDRRCIPSFIGNFGD